MSEYYQKPNDENQDSVKKDWQQRLCSQVMEEWDKGRQFVSDLDTLYDDLYRMLRGERPLKNYDWESNVVINKVFQVVWTAVPYFIQKIFGATPVIGVSGFDQKGCWQREMLLDKWRAKDKFVITATLAILRGLLNGVAYVKKGWKQKVLQDGAEQEMTTPYYDNEGYLKFGKTTIKAKMSLPVEDRPEDTVLNNKDVVVDWSLQPGQSCREGRFFIHREPKDIQELRASGLYSNLDNVNPQQPQQTSSMQDREQLKKIDKQENPPEQEFYQEVEVFERQGVLPVKKVNGKEFSYKLVEDDKELKGDDVEWIHMVVAIADKNNPTLIRFEPNSYEEISIIDLHIYLDPERWNSMGMVEPFKDLQTALNDNINAMFDEIWMNLFPPTMFNQFAVFDWDSIQYAPRQKWLLSGNPDDIVKMPKPTNITSDAWQKHLLFDSEIQLTSSITPPTQGMDKSKTATQGVLNAQFSTGKLDFVLTMIEQTFLIPDAEMTIRFAQKFGCPLTFIAILGGPFKFDIMPKEEYKFQPVASSVKLEQQKETEVSQDIQLIQIVQAVPNPNTPKILNYFLSNILRNRNRPQLAQLFDEDFFEPKTDAGNMQMMQRQFGPGTPSNEQGIAMSDTERSVRNKRSETRGMM